MLKPRCADCYFYDIKIAVGGARQGICRHNLPNVASVWVPTGRDAQGQPNGMGTLQMTIWPSVEESDWCGKFSVEPVPSN